MLSKLLSVPRVGAPIIRISKIRLMKPATVPCRVYSELIPPSQYDTPFPKKFVLTYAMVKYYEIIPLVIVTFVALSILTFAIIFTCLNKVDVVTSSHSRNNISRTMDLMHPTAHKLILIHQRYEPWPEMAEVLRKMAKAEMRLYRRMGACNIP